MIATLATIICLLVVACLFYKGVFLKWGSEVKLEAQLKEEEKERRLMREYTDRVKDTLHKVQTYSQQLDAEEMIRVFERRFFNVEGIIEELQAIQPVLEATQRRVERNEAVMILYN